jgi:putative ABC transport system permease protein
MAGLPSAIGHQIKGNLPEVENVVRISERQGREPSLYFRYVPSGDSSHTKTFSVDNWYWCDSTVFEIFGFRFIHGDPESALKDPYTCVLTQSTARRIFGELDPVGVTLERTNRGHKSWFTVTGIIEDVKDSHLKIDLLGSMTSHDSVRGNKPYEWYPRGHPLYLNTYTNRDQFTYITLAKGTDPAIIQGRINDSFKDKAGEFATFQDGKSFSLSPLKDIYFSPRMKDEGSYRKFGNLERLRLLITIAIIILFLAGINYLNLTTARSTLRVKEIGVRKVSGSSRTLLAIQFLVESTLVAMISLLVALTLVQILLPSFNRISSMELTTDILLKWEAVISYLSLTVLLGIISGLYPAIYLSRMRVVPSGSDRYTRESGMLFFRGGLLTIQFAVSIILLIGILVIFRQLVFMKSADLGFDRDLIINVQHRSNFGDDWEQKLFKQELLKNPRILGVAFSGSEMGNLAYTRGSDYEFNGIKNYCAVLPVDPDFINVMGISILEGRNLTYDIYRDYYHWDSAAESRVYSVLLNESAVSAFRLDSPIGNTGKILNGFNVNIIGVVKDFHFHSLHQKINPTLYIFGPRWFYEANVKIAPDAISATIRYMKKVFESVYPGYVFEYSYLDKTFDLQYVKDEQTASLIIIFALVALLIACLGLFGLAFFMAARRTKEIGIRKTVGASDRTIFILLSIEFIKWISLSVIIACPLALIIMKGWLQNFAYRTNIPAWIFAVAIMFAYGISFVIIAWHAWKTARTNPIEALRYE